MKELEFFILDNGKNPVQEWILTLDISTQARIYARLTRMQDGNFGDYKKINSDISEVRFKFGSGYRIYFSEINNTLVLLLCAGDKKTQSHDIKKAEQYLKIWKGNQNG